MGRSSGYNDPDQYYLTQELPEGCVPLLFLRKVPVNPGGYDPGGAYWGLGDPLWCAWSDNPDLIVYIRASRRFTAKALIKKYYPSVRFYR
jgi:hypothetical protein